MTNEKATFLLRLLNSQKKMVKDLLSPDEGDGALRDIEEAISIIKLELWSNDRRSQKRKK